MLFGSGRDLGDSSQDGAAASGAHVAHASGSACGGCMLLGAGHGLLDLVHNLHRQVHSSRGCAHRWLETAG